MKNIVFVILVRQDAHDILVFVQRHVLWPVTQLTILTEEVKEHNHEELDDLRQSKVRLLEAIRHAHQRSTLTYTLLLDVWCERNNK